jgi:hypothetical protein
MAGYLPEIQTGYIEILKQKTRLWHLPEKLHGVKNQENIMSENHPLYR